MQGVGSPLQILVDGKKMAKFFLEGISRGQKDVHLELSKPLGLAQAGVGQQSSQVTLQGHAWSVGFSQRAAKSQGEERPDGSIPVTKKAGSSFN